MKKGFGVFGKEYEFMFRNDLHDSSSIDVRFLNEMVLLDEGSTEFLYGNVKCYDMRHHELFAFAQQFKRDTEKSTIQCVLDFTCQIASDYDVEFEEMIFGGTEKEILERGTDWCADMARLSAVLLDCLKLPCRILHLANLDLAYNGHVVNEVFYEGKWGVIDPIHGFLFYKEGPVDAAQLQKEPQLLGSYAEDYQGLYKGIAINEYDPMDKANDYTVSKANEYYKRLIFEDHHNQWIMGEDE